MVSLVKGQKVDLTKGNAGLKKILVGLGWDTNKYDGDDFDLDASAFLLDKNGKVTTDKDFVFFNNLVHPSGAVKHYLILLLVGLRKKTRSRLRKSIMKKIHIQYISRTEVISLLWLLIQW